MPAPDGRISKVFYVWWLRVGCFAVRKVLAALTVLRRGFGDPTTILVDQLTPEQIAAEAALRAPAANLSEVRRIVVVVPFRDRWDLTKTCLETLRRQEIGGLAVTVALVDNGSVEEATLTGIRETMTAPKREGLDFRLFRLEMPFNFSKLNNVAVERCADVDAHYVLLLNNDIEMTSTDGLQKFAKLLETNPQVGAVGCTLLYPDGRIQHSFVAPGVKIVGAHPLKFMPFQPAYRWFERPRAVAGLTGAVLMVRASCYRSVGGLQEDLPTSYQDVDFCLKVLAQGFFLVTMPDVVMVHHESASRKKDLPAAEIAWMYQRWGDYLTANPYYSTRLSRWSEAPVYSFGEGKYPWQRFI